MTMVWNVDNGYIGWKILKEIHVVNHVPLDDTIKNYMELLGGREISYVLDYSDTDCFSSKVYDVIIEKDKCDDTINQIINFMQTIRMGTDFSINMTIGDEKYIF